MFIASELEDVDIERNFNSVSSCRIPKDILATNYVFATFDNYAWELQHNDRVPVCGSIYLLCGDGGSKFTCKPDGSFSPKLPTTNCAQVFSPTVREDSNDPTCRTPNLAMYRIGYQFGEFFMEIYRTCYDKTGYAAQFSIHKVYRSDERAPRPSATFTLDGAMTVSESNAMRNNNIYERFKKILGNGQTYMAPGSYLFNRGHLTAPADFPFAHQQKATFKIRNVVPQYAEVNNGNWKAV
ncbi:hypothetical protein KR054_012107 [Drosophila jambulina]|nr:hypothetical protein KR054_012107 [Drosophila jambulina]